MLHSRYKDDGLAHIELNDLQESVAENVKMKIKCGDYSFSSHSCNICKSEVFEPISGKDRYGIRHDVQLCENCGLIQVNPRMIQESFTKYYDSEYRSLHRGVKEFNQEYFNKKYNSRGKNICEFLDQEIDEITNLRVVEVGCAEGANLYRLKEQGCDVFGCDLDSERVKFGKNNYDLNLEVGSLEMVDLPWTPDIVIYSHVLEHLLDPVEEIKKSPENI